MVLANGGMFPLGPAHQSRWIAAGGFALPSIQGCLWLVAWTARHKQAAVHTVWSTSGQLTLYGFRNVDGRWLCVAASDERKQRTDPWLKCGSFRVIEEEIPH